GGRGQHWILARCAQCAEPRRACPDERADVLCGTCLPLTVGTARPSMLIGNRAAAERASPDGASDWEPTFVSAAARAASTLRNRSGRAVPTSRIVIEHPSNVLGDSPDR